MEGESGPLEGCWRGRVVAARPVWSGGSQGRGRPFTRSPVPSPPPILLHPVLSLSLFLPPSLPSPPRLASSASLRHCPFHFSSSPVSSTIPLPLFVPQNRCLSLSVPPPRVDRRGSSGCLSPFLSSGPRTGAGLTKLHRLFVIYLYFGSDRRQLVLV